MEFKPLSTSISRVPHIILCSSSSPPFTATVLAAHPFPAALQAAGRSCKAIPQACVRTSPDPEALARCTASSTGPTRAHGVTKHDGGAQPSPSCDNYTCLCSQRLKKDEISSKVGPEHTLFAICIFTDDATHLSRSPRWRSRTICSVVVSKPIALVQKKKMLCVTKTNTFLPSSLIYTPALCMGKTPDK